MLDSELVKLICIIFQSFHPPLEKDIFISHSVFTWQKSHIKWTVDPNGKTESPHHQHCGAPTHIHPPPHGDFMEADYVYSTVRFLEGWPDI